MRKIILAGFLVLMCSAAFAKTVVIDVRTPQEYAASHIQGALNIDYRKIGKTIGMSGAGKDDDIILYCRSGRRAGAARAELLRMGFKHVENFGGLEDARKKLAARK